MAKTRKTSDAQSKQSVVATDPISVLGLQYEPSNVVRSIDVGRLHSILSSAESGDTRDLMALYRDIIAQDSHMLGEFAKRKMAVVGDTMDIVPWDATDPDDVAAAEAIQDNMSEVRNWIISLAHLLDSSLYPVALAEKIFTPSGEVSPAFRFDRLVHVPHHLLDYTQGTMRLYDVDPATRSVLSTTHLPDPNRYIIHRGHIMTTPDNWGGPMRAILFWWLLATMGREWWSRFLDRYGHPFLVGTYPRGDKDSKSVLERAFALSVRLGGLVISEGTKVEIQQAAAAQSGDAYERFISFCNREKSKLIVGQTLSAEAQSTGMNSGVSVQQELVRQDIRKFDASQLADTVRTQLFAQILQVNGLSGRPPHLRFGKDAAEAAQRMTSTLKELRSTDFEPDDSAIPAINSSLGLSVRRRSSAPVSPFSAFAQSVVRRGTA